MAKGLEYPRIASVRCSELNRVLWEGLVGIFKKKKLMNEFLASAIGSGSEKISKIFCQMLF